ncbi:MAG: ParB/RepB/Spo0J family partition protein [Desulfobaccales bacterium]
MAKPKPKATGDCLTCPFKKAMMNKAKGKKLPREIGGKCTRPGGICEDMKKGASSQAPQTTAPDSPKPGNEIELSLIYPNPDQPRKVFDQGKLEELAQSIKEQGLIEPLVVVPRLPKFMLVAGERRWRACQIAGLTAAPVRIICANDDQVAEMALVENIQRQDLTPLEEAKAFKEMIDRGYTREALAQKLGFKQVWRVDERLSLLTLAPKYQEALVFGVLGSSQAFEMSRMDDPADQELVFRKIKGGGLPTYNHLRRFVNTILEAKKDRVLFNLPKQKDLETINRWEKALDAVTGLIVKSFSLEDCQVLSKVFRGNAQLNIAKIDLLIKHLDMMRKAMLENSSRQEVAAIIQEGGEDTTLQVSW